MGNRTRLSFRVRVGLRVYRIEGLFVGEQHFGAAAVGDLADRRAPDHVAGLHHPATDLKGLVEIDLLPVGVQMTIARATVLRR